MTRLRTIGGAIVIALFCLACAAFPIFASGAEVDLADDSGFQTVGVGFDSPQRLHD